MRRPRSVTLVALALAGLAAVNLLGVVTGVQRYTVLRDLPLSVPPTYLVLSSAVWAVVFGPLALGLWRCKHWARLGAPLALALYLAVVWVERLVLGRSDFVRATVPYYLTLHLLSLVVVSVTLLRRKARQAFTD
jgi:hypothetical protein